MGFTIQVLFHIENIYDVISLSLVPLYAVPGMIGLVKYSPAYILCSIAAPFVSFTNELIKKRVGKLSDNPIFYRPKGAVNCTLLNGRCDPNAPAFPSGHVATTTYIVYTLYRLTFRNAIDSYFIHLTTAIIYVCLMGYSRYAKRCHNIPQVVAGVGYGLLCGTLFDFAVLGSRIKMF